MSCNCRDFNFVATARTHVRMRSDARLEFEKTSFPVLCMDMGMTTSRTHSPVYMCARVCVSLCVYMCAGSVLATWYCRAALLSCVCGVVCLVVNRMITAHPLMVDG